MKKHLLKGALVAMIALFAQGVLAAETKVGGFVDGQYQWQQKMKEGRQAFNIYDAALYVSHEMDNTRVMVDLPLNPSNASLFNSGKSQLYVAHKTSFGLDLTLGRFDTIYGTELNDSADIRFTRFGLIQSTVLPVTHTGLLGAYELAPSLMLRAMVTNESLDTTFSDTNNNQGGNMQFGAQLAFAPKPYRLSAGFLTKKVGDNTGMFINLMAGGDIGDFALDFEFDTLKQAVAGAETGIGLLAQVAYNFNQSLSAGIRGEMTDKVAAVGTKQYKLTVGPQYKLTKAMTLKADYTFDSTKPSGGSSTNNSTVALAAVYRI